MDDPFGNELAQADAFSDLPVPLHYRTYAEHLPDARFILTTRNEESWLKSMEWLIENGPKIWGGPGTTWESGGVVERLHQRVFGTQQFEPEKMLAAYRAHNSEVLDFFCEDPRFLHLQLEDTLLYEDLAKFVGIETRRRGPLPRANPRRRPLPSALRGMARRLGFFR